MLLKVTEPLREKKALLALDDKKNSMPEDPVLLRKRSRSPSPGRDREFVAFLLEQVKEKDRQLAEKDNQYKSQLLEREKRAGVETELLTLQFERRLDDAQRTIDAQKAEIQRLKQVFPTVQDALPLDCFQEDLNAKDAALAEAKTLLDTKDAQLADAKTLLDTKDAQLASIKTLLDAKNIALAEVKTLLDTKDAQLTEAKFLLGTKDAQLAEANAQIQAYHEEFMAYSRSLLVQLVQGTRCFTSTEFAFTYVGTRPDWSQFTVLRRADLPVSQLFYIKEAVQNNVHYCYARLKHPCRESQIQIALQQLSCPHLTMGPMLHEHNPLRCNFIGHKIATAQQNGTLFTWQA